MKKNAQRSREEGVAEVEEKFARLSRLYCEQEEMVSALTKDVSMQEALLEQARDELKESRTSQRELEERALKTDQERARLATGFQELNQHYEDKRAEIKAIEKELHESRQNQTGDTERLLEELEKARLAGHEALEEASRARQVVSELTRKNDNYQARLVENEAASRLLGHHYQDLEKRLGQLYDEHSRSLVEKAGAEKELEETKLQLNTARNRGTKDAVGDLPKPGTGYPANYEATSADPMPVWAQTETIAPESRAAFESIIPPSPWSYPSLDEPTKKGPTRDKSLDSPPPVRIKVDPERKWGSGMRETTPSTNWKPRSQGLSTRFPSERSERDTFGLKPVDRAPPPTSRPFQTPSRGNAPEPDGSDGSSDSSKRSRRPDSSKPKKKEEKKKKKRHNRRSREDPDSDPSSSSSSESESSESDRSVRKKRKSKKKTNRKQRDRSSDRNRSFSSLLTMAPKISSHMILAVEEFLLEMTRFKQTNNVTDRDMISLFEDRIKNSPSDPLKSWWRSVLKDDSPRPKTWADTAIHFKRSFKVFCQGGHLEGLLRNRARKEDESVRSYLARTKDMAHYVGWTEAQAVDMIVESINIDNVMLTLKDVIYPPLGPALSPPTLEACLHAFMKIRYDVDAGVTYTLVDILNHASEEVITTAISTRPVSRSRKQLMLTEGSNPVSPVNKPSLDPQTLSSLLGYLAPLLNAQGQNPVRSSMPVAAVSIPGGAAIDQAVLSPPGTITFQSHTNPEVKILAGPDLRDTATGIMCCGRCLRSGHGRADCFRNTCVCPICHEAGHIRQEHWVPGGSRGFGGGRGGRGQGGRGGRGNGGNGGGARSRFAEQKCWICQEAGHFARDCKTDQGAAVSVNAALLGYPVPDEDPRDPSLHGTALN